MKRKVYKMIKREYRTIVLISVILSFLLIFPDSSLKERIKYFGNPDSLSYDQLYMNYTLFDENGPLYLMYYYDFEGYRHFNVRINDNNVYNEIKGDVDYLDGIMQFTHGEYTDTLQWITDSTIYVHIYDDSAEFILNLSNIYHIYPLDSVGNAMFAGKNYHYYSIPDIDVEGVVRCNYTMNNITGKTWMERTWSENTQPENLWLNIMLNNDNNLLCLLTDEYDLILDQYHDGVVKSYPVAMIKTVSYIIHNNERRSFGWRVSSPKRDLDLFIKPLTDKCIMNKHLYSVPCSIYGTMEKEGVEGIGYSEIYGDYDINRIRQDSLNSAKGPLESLEHKFKVFMKYLNVNSPKTQNHNIK